MRSEHRDVRLRHPRRGLGGGSLRAIDGREQDPDQDSATAECLEEDGEGLVESKVPFESVVPELLHKACDEPVVVKSSTLGIVSDLSVTQSHPSATLSSLCVP